MNQGPVLIRALIRLPSHKGTHPKRRVRVPLQMTPNASIASATRLKPTMLAPMT